MAYKKGIRIFVIILVILAVVAAIVLYNIYRIKDNPQAQFASQEELAEQKAALPSDHVNYDDNTASLDRIEMNGSYYVRKENVVNILLLGVDSDSDRVKQSMGWRSDMIMLCSMDFDTNKISFISIPRDTRAVVSRVDSDGKVTSESLDKLNAAYAYGGGPSKYSAQNAMRCVSLLLECDDRVDVPIDYYISIDLDGLPKLASALDGVEVTLDQNFPDLGKKGATVNLTGDKVRKYLENRKDMQDGETDRQRHEQEFIKSMAKKIKQMGAVSAAPKLFDTFVNFMETNLSLDQVLSFAFVLDEASLDEMDFLILEDGHPETIDGVWYYIASQNEMFPLMVELLYMPE